MNSLRLLLQQVLRALPTVGETTSRHRAALGTIHACLSFLPQWPCGGGAVDGPFPPIHNPGNWLKEVH